MGRFSVDFVAEGLGRAHQMRFGAYSLYGQSNPILSGNRKQGGEASGNGFLRSQALQLQKRLQPFRRMQLQVRGRVRQSLGEHRRIRRAIETGDGDAAARELREHVSVQGERFFDLMSSLNETGHRRAG